MVLALARNFIHPAETGLAFGMLETANAAAVILAPLLAGALYQRAPVSVYTVALGLTGVAFAINLGVLPVLVQKPAPAAAKEEIE